MAIEAGVCENFVDLRVCCETIHRSRSRLYRCRVAAARTSREKYRGRKRNGQTHRKQTLAPKFSVIGHQIMHCKLSLKLNRVIVNSRGTENSQREKNRADCARDPRGPRRT